MFGGDFKGTGPARGDEGAAIRPEASPRPCPACGAAARREGARFCATCGRRLDEAHYFPTDSLRASYHQQSTRQDEGAGPAAPAVGPTHGRGRTRGRRRARPRLFSLESDMSNVTSNRNGASTTALAFATYALVPYLGILFCPGALLLGGIGLVRARRDPRLGGRRASVASITWGLVTLGAQVLLWWILYKVPEWARQP